MMEKYRNKKGFTLVELIVVIAIVAALSISMGISAIDTMKQTRIKGYRETYADIFQAAQLYYKLKEKPLDCSSYIDGITCGEIEMSPVTPSSTDLKGSTKLCCLVESGLLDESYLTTVDPLAGDKEDFKCENVINYAKYSSDGKMEVSIPNTKCGNVISTVNYKDYSSWEGEC